MDRKADHVGNHGGAYTDVDGMSKQFTYIDHDKKTTISMHKVENEEKWDPAKYRAELIKRITDQPASNCHEFFHDYTIRGDSSPRVEWNTDMLIDPGVPLNILRDLCVILENRTDLAVNGQWR